VTLRGDDAHEKVLCEFSKNWKQDGLITEASNAPSDPIQNHPLKQLSYLPHRATALFLTPSFISPVTALAATPTVTLLDSTKPCKERAFHV